jgi:predicted nucleic acid-binding Zn ribbon protein
MILISVEQMLSSASTSMLSLKCDGCQQEFQRIQKQIKSDYKLKSQIQHFCSNKCQASLIKKELIKLTCANCNVDFSTTQSDFNQRSKKSSKLCCSKLCANKINTYRSQEAKNKISASLKKAYDKKLQKAEHKVLSRGCYKIAHIKNTCIVCSKEFFRNRDQKTCSNECYFIVRQNAGKKGGSKTSSLEFHKRNRSSNEKMFFAKIKEIYPDAIANKRLFDGWDADVIIPSQKLAIHWNGVWHYKSIMGNELLERVQQKDKLRYEAIEKHGYKNYIIQDMGPMNSNKVEKEYVDFLQNVKEQSNI